MVRVLPRVEIDQFRECSNLVVPDRGHVEVDVWSSKGAKISSISKRAGHFSVFVYKHSFLLDESDAVVRKENGRIRHFALDTLGGTLYVVFLSSVTKSMEQSGGAVTTGRAIRPELHRSHIGELPHALHNCKTQVQV
jgi:hypothetical protein